ncbi:unnamed protein product [Rotaria socialis]|uniref:Uncharacterized protein n=2 Tax=Rotaria socialis TaxID=392032 RepID=A0A817XUB7_9BILA|nr:unnamed protein product [Rotaria socialis]CAF3468529.1 unnamed protein product [Rotaria socialis]
MTSTLLIFSLMCVYAAVSYKIADDSCPLPSSLKPKYDFSWRSKSGEWSNTQAKTSYMMLALSWSPSYCASLSQSARDQKFQCFPSNSFGLIVHGLWPQVSNAANVRAHPRNCRDEPQLNATFVKRYFCIMPDEDLVQGEWEKHGTCYYPAASDYYTIAEYLFKSLQIPEYSLLNTGSATIIKNAFLTLNVPTLFGSAVRVDMNSNGRLKEVKICYNLQYQFATCA